MLHNKNIIEKEKIMSEITFDELTNLVGNLASGMALLSEAFADYAKTIHECMMENNSAIAEQFEKVESRVHDIDETLVKLNDKIDIAGSLLELSLCGPQNN
jgi:hypothetical protein